MCFPATKPLHLTLGVFDEGRGAGEGGQVAAKARHRLKSVTAWGEGAQRLLESAVQQGALPHLTYFQILPSRPAHLQLLSSGRLGRLETVERNIDGLGAHGATSGAREPAGPSAPAEIGIEYYTGCRRARVPLHPRAPVHPTNSEVPHARHHAPSRPGAVGARPAFHAADQRSLPRGDPGGPSRICRWREAPRSVKSSAPARPHSARSPSSAMCRATARAFRS
jgi:hypothetical protein